jgi:hypothetical protein
VWKAESTFGAWNPGRYRNPDQIAVHGKVGMVMWVTMPKLLEPPFRARQRVGWEVKDAVVMRPEARIRV